MNFGYFLQGYVTALLWSSGDNDHESLEDFELAPETMEKCRADCRRFIAMNSIDLERYATTYTPATGYNVAECAGHDFWLTRAGHGVGFWDRDLGELGDRLTGACEQFKNVEAYLGDDLKVYLS